MSFSYESFQKFEEVLNFTNKYNDEKYTTIIIGTSSKSALIAVRIDEDFVDGAIFYYEDSRWKSIVNSHSRRAVSHFIGYLDACDNAFTEEDEDDVELGGIDL